MKRLCTVILLIMLFAACAAGFGFVVSAEAPTLSRTDIYDRGTVLDLSEEVMSVNGQSYPADVTVIMPSGTGYNADSIVLSETGKYELLYSCVAGGKVYRETRYILVEEDMYGVAGKDSSANYTEYEFDDPSGTTVKEGILVDLTADSVFTFNNIIDLRGMTKNDRLISLNIIPSVIGEADFHILEITFTDIYDPTNYLQVTLTDVDDGNYLYEDIGAYPNYQYTYWGSYAKAGAAGQPQTGYYSASDIVYTNSYGALLKVSFNGTPFPFENGTSAGVLSEDTFDVYMDYESRAVYGTKKDVSNNFIVDLDDPTYFESLWNGFTTGEVTVSVSASSFDKASGRVFIQDICGMDLSKETLSDREPPLIEIDMLGYEEPPAGIAGEGYPVFPAKAFDRQTGITPVEVHVFANYGTNTKNETELLDGEFYPTRAGIYTIEYSSEDKFGNRSVSVVQVSVVEEHDPPELVLDGQGTLSATVGIPVQIDSCTVTGEIGRVEITAEVSKNGKTVDVSDNCFIPTEEGKYTVKLTAKDFLQRSDSKEYTVEALYSPAPIVSGSISFPKYFIAGYTYKIPSLYGFDYRTGKEFQCIVTVKDGAGDRIVAESFVPAVEKNGDIVEIQYVCSNGVASGEPVVYKVPCYIVRNGEDLDMRGYFIPSNGTISVESSADGITLQTDEEGAAAEFLNVLKADGFNIKFSAVGEQSNFSSFNIFLKDAENEELSVKISFTARTGGSVLQINGTGNYPVAYLFSRGDEFLLSYSNADMSVKTLRDLSLSAKIYEYESGEPFEGFPSGKIRMYMSFEGVQGLSAVTLKSLNEQPLSSAVVDTVRPQIYIDGLYGGVYSVGKDAVIPPIYVFDVLDPNPTVTMTVTSPDGSIVTSEDGTVLDGISPNGMYSFRLAEYGRYVVTLTAKDSSGRSRNMSFIYTVIDEVPPEIDFSAKQTEAKAGKTVKVSAATAKDNIDGAVEVFTFAVAPDGCVFTVGDSFVADLRGEYQVIYMAFDSQGNTATEMYTVTVR